MKQLVLDPMRHLPDQWVIPRLAPSEAVEPDHPGLQVHLRTNQAMDPAHVHLEGPAQDLGPTRGIGPPQIDDPAPQRGLKVQVPALREGPAWRRRLDPIGAVTTQGRHMATRPVDQPVQVGVLEPGPDPRLPGAVILLDRRLEARFARGHEHGDDPQAQAQPADTSHGAGMGMSPLEDRVIVELGRARQAELAPMLHEALDDELRRDTLPARPRRDQPAMQRDAVEDLDVGPRADDRPLDDVEAVEFPTAAGHFRQIPTARRWRTSDPAWAVQHATAVEDAVDRPQRGERLDPAGSKGVADRFGPVEAQIALVAQLASHVEDEVLDGGGGPLGGVRSARPIGPIDAVESSAVGVVDPAVDGRGAHMELSGDFVLRSTAPNGLDHGPAAGGFLVSLLMVRSSQEGPF